MNQTDQIKKIVNGWRRAAKQGKVSSERLRLIETFANYQLLKVKAQKEGRCLTEEERVAWIRNILELESGALLRAMRKSVADGVVTDPVGLLLFTYDEGAMDIALGILELSYPTPRMVVDRLKAMTNLVYWATLIEDRQRAIDVIADCNPPLADVLRQPPPHGKSYVVAIGEGKCFVATIDLVREAHDGQNRI